MTDVADRVDRASAPDSQPRPAGPAGWRSVDALGEALHFLRMTGIFYTRSEFTAPFGLQIPPMRAWLMFHVVTTGQCWIEVEGADRRRLRPGDLALVPRGEGHRLVSEAGVPAAPLFSLPREIVSERYEILRHGGGGAPVTMICGAMRFDDPAAHHLVRLLPRVIRVDAGSASETEWLQSTLRFMAAEARELRAGGEAVITRLADILIIQAIRAWMAREPAAQQGWLAALRDPQIGRAVALIHRDPARRWTVVALARAAGMSRSAFAARFTQLLGEPAMHYAARWKMHAAQLSLERENASLGELAARLGYESEAAFSRAFKRFVGVTPGTIRRRDRAAAS